MNILTVSGRTLDLYDDEIVNLNIQVNDISDISTRNSTYSNSFSIPRTSNNTEIFKFTGVIGNTSRMPYQKVECRYTQDDIPIITSGYLEITDTTPEDYMVVMYDGIISLSEAIKNKKLSDLDLSAYNHTLSETNYTNSFSATSGYIYAMAHFSDVNPPSDTGDFELEYQAPSMYVHTLFDEIITQAGYTYEGDIFTDADYLSLVVTPTNGYTITASTTSETFLGDFSTETISVNSNEPTYSTYIYNYDFDIGTPITEISNLISELEFNFNGRVELDMSHTYDTTYGNFFCEVLLNGALVKRFSYPESVAPSSGVDTASATFEVSIGDTLTVATFAYPEFIGGSYRLTFDSQMDLSFTEIDGGQNINIATLYGNEYQAAFIKDIMQHYGMVMVKDIGTDNHLKFTTMESLLQDKTNAEDWTNKLVSISNEAYSVDGYAKNSFMNYKYDKEIEVQEYNGFLIIDNEHIDDFKTLFTSIFTIRHYQIEDMGEPLYFIPLWKQKTVNGVQVDEPNKTNLTLFKPKMVNDSISFTVYSGTPVNFTGDIPFVSFEDIDYQYFIDNYYTQFQLLLDTNKKITATVNLNSIELLQLDFFKLKYLKQTGKYYYLNSIKARNGKNATVELIEINN